MAQFAMVAMIAIGLNVVVGQAGLLDLGYVGFYAVGAYTVALLTSPDSPWNQTGPDGLLQHDWAWLALRAAGHGDHRARRADPRHPDAAAARRLPGHRHPGVRRDRPAAGRQPGRHHQRRRAACPRWPTRGSGETEKLPDGVFSSGNSAGHANYGTWWFWLSV